MWEHITSKYRIEKKGSLLQGQDYNACFDPHADASGFEMSTAIQAPLGLESSSCPEDPWRSKDQLGATGKIEATGEEP